MINTKLANHRVLTAVAFGDAFGAPYEIPSGELSPKPVAPFMVQNPRLGTDYGQWTDDAALNIAGGLALVRNKGSYDRETAVTYYREALLQNTNHAPALSDLGRMSFYTLLRHLPPLGWGSTVSGALTQGMANPTAKSCGALMRAPVLFYATGLVFEADLYQLVKADASITHEDTHAYVFGYSLIQRYLASKEAYSMEEVIKKSVASMNTYYAVESGLATLLMDLIQTPDSQLLIQKLRDDFSGSTARDVFVSSIVMAFRTRRRISMRITDFISAYASCAEACEIGGDTDTRCALMLPLCWQCGSLPYNFTAPDLVNALDIALSTFLNKSR